MHRQRRSFVRWFRALFQPGRRRRARLVAQLLGLGLLAVFVAVRIWDPLPAQLVRYTVFDQYQLLLPRPSTSGEVVIVDLDEASLARHGQWPWPRTLLARLVDRLFAQGADVVAFDIVFAEPDRLSPPNLTRELNGLSPALLGTLQGLPDNDAAFAESIAANKVALGQPALHNLPRGADTEATPAGTVVELGGDPRPFLQRYAGLVRNLPILEASAGGIGTVSIALDQDGMVRRVPLAIVVGGRILPALGIEALRLRADEQSLVIRRGANGIAGVNVGGHQVPTDRHGRIWIRYGAAGSVHYLTAADVMAGLVEPGALDGRIVLVGSTAAGLFDVKRTPLSPATPGIEVQAHLLETVLTGNFLLRPPLVEGAEIVALVVACLLVIVLVPLLGALATLFIGSGLMAALAGLSWYLFAEHLILFDASFAALASFAIYALITYLKYMLEEGERKAVRTAFAQYLPPQVVEQLAAHPEQLRLGGEARSMTLLFSDIRGFTSIAESLDPEELSALVNRILGAMTGAILEHGGTVDKYIGDCIMAFWNAPLDDPDHARNGCRAALAVVEAACAFNREAAAAAAGHRQIEVGVGVNTGRAVVGNFGSHYRFDYTALGDTVNLAARLEGLAPIYGVPVVIGEATAAAVPDFALLELDTVQVKGRREAVRIFAVLGDERLADTTDFAALRAAHTALLEAMAAGAVVTAERALATARSLAGPFALDQLYGIYAERLDAIRPASVPLSESRSLG